MEQPTSYTLSEAMRELGIENRRTLDKWMRRLKIKPERHAFDLRFWCISAEAVEAIRQARAQMPATTRRERPERPVPRMVVPDILSVLPGRVSVPVRRQSQGDAPEGWQPLPEWCRTHDIALMTATKASEKGRYGRRFSITKEAYRWNGTATLNWLTPDQQVEFHLAFPDRLGDPCRACGWSSSMVATTTEEEATAED